MAFPKFFRHRPTGAQYQIAMVMADQSAPGVIMTFQYEVFDYHPMNGEAEMKLFNYQPDILVQTTQVVMPGLAEMQRDANWEEGTVSWSDLANLAIPSWNVMDTVEVDCAA